MLVPLMDKHGVCDWASVDDADAPLVAARPWHMTAQGYAGSSPYALMHRVVTGAAPHEEVDHRDRDRLNNQRENLRLVPVGANAQNCGARHVRANASVRTSRFRGVFWWRTRNCWRARYARKHIGYFASEVEAALAVEEYRRTHVPFAEPDPALSTI